MLLRKVHLLAEDLTFTLNSDTLDTETMEPRRCYCVMKKLLRLMNEDPELCHKIYPKQGSGGSEEQSGSTDANTQTDMGNMCIYTKLHQELLKDYNERAYPQCSHEGQFDMDQLEITDKFLSTSVENVVVYGALMDEGRTIEVAVKMKLTQFDDVVEEISGMRKLIHPNIVHIVGFNLEHGIILTEYMKNGNLHSACTEAHDTSQLFKYIFQVINGVTFIHGERYIHRDLETSNVFIDGDGVCKIGDLENAVFMGDRLEYIEKVKPLHYHHYPKEAYEQQKFSYCSDIYSLAYLVMEVLLSPNVKAPADKSYMMSEFEKIANSERCSDSVYQMVMKTLLSDPEERPTIEDFYNLFVTYI
ncbi:tyrosine-protein kinase SRK3 isoform X2 [Aethina tumida]|uniref:tyrosine-protein kinase SRK3 isoform X2 n=1 Tax=Aethina tumida TaxID=116153 RepID=UPI0021483330|nr:tyrosine-protein kinase SRK3 isoform X2 [Aethina tumida]